MNELLNTFMYDIVLKENLVNIVILKKQGILREDHLKYSDTLKLFEKVARCRSRASVEKLIEKIGEEKLKPSISPSNWSIEASGHCSMQAILKKSAYLSPPSCFVGSLRPY